ncbi:hypothetical protein LSAT2_012832, partial [Lamellibrachia satsuma]
EACNLRGLLEDDVHGNSTLAEAAATKSPNRFRILFAIMIAAYGLSDPKQLWENNQEILTEDILLQVGRENPGTEVQYTPAIFNKALTLLDDKVLSMVDTKLKVYGLPAP